MGTLGGHLLPGAFFIIFSVWWSFITAIRYVQSKMRSPFKKNSLVGYRGTVTMPCICLPCGKLRRAPIESYAKLILGSIGLAGELITGIKFYPQPQPIIDKIFVSSNPMEHMNHGSEGAHAHIHRRDAAMIPNVPVKTWELIESNQQHSTMYSIFIIGSIVEILMYHRIDVPPRLDYVIGIISFGIEAFLFANHTHSKTPLEVHVHSLLVFAIYGCIICSALETYNPNQILFTYGRILFVLLQGTWFCDIGFILYPPTDNPAYQWDPNDHNLIMTVTVMYCWHVILILIGLLIQLAIMKRIYGSSKKVSDRFDELIEIDYEANQAYTVKEQNGIETRFISINSEDEDSVDEHVEFDTAKLLKTSSSTRNNEARTKIKMNSFDNPPRTNPKSPDSTSSSTSGNFSANTNC